VTSVIAWIGSRTALGAALGVAGGGVARAQAGNMHTSSKSLSRARTRLSFLGG
jgi:hypothetical protein